MQLGRRSYSYEWLGCALVGKAPRGPKGSTLSVACAAVDSCAMPSHREPFERGFRATDLAVQMELNMMHLIPMLDYMGWNREDSRIDFAQVENQN